MTFSTFVTGHTRLASGRDVAPLEALETQVVLPDKLYSGFQGFAQKFLTFRDRMIAVAEKTCFGLARVL